MVYRPLAFSAEMRASREERLATAQADTSANISSVGIAEIREIGAIAAPTNDSVLEVTEAVQVESTLDLPTFTATPILGQTYEGYGTLRVVGRFSNYWPPFGGTNCFSDCELFADGNRVDQAITEGWKVLACPREILPGTRIEFPIESGLIWTCRDYGEAITMYFAESGLPIYWFDFLSDTAFVDFGSYIQVDIHVPCGQLEHLEGCD